MAIRVEPTENRGDAQLEQFAKEVIPLLRRHERSLIGK